MYRTNIYLDEKETRALKHLAAEERCSVAELVRRAVDQYLAQRLGEGKDWGERFDELVARIQRRVRADVTPGEIEADITAAREEVRWARRRAREDSRSSWAPTVKELITADAALLPARGDAYSDPKA